MFLISTFFKTQLYSPHQSLSLRACTDFCIYIPCCLLFIEKVEQLSAIAIRPNERKVETILALWFQKKLFLASPRLLLSI